MESTDSNSSTADQGVLWTRKRRTDEVEGYVPRAKRKTEAPLLHRKPTGNLEHRATKLRDEDLPTKLGKCNVDKQGVSEDALKNVPAV